MSTFFSTFSISAELKVPKKVVVVGAGLAGLTTAYRLQQKGLDVEVYEARNRVGGRVFTVEIEDKIVELGGQNIADGGEANHILRLAEELTLELVRNKVILNDFYFSKDGLIPIQKLLDSKQFNLENLRIQLQELAQKSKNMREILDKILEKEDPLYKVLAVRLAAYEGGSIDDLSPIYIETLYHMLCGGIAAAHKRDMEEKFINFLSIKGGNALLTEKLAESLTNKLHLNKILKHVSKNVEGSFVLTFQDNQQIIADILVLAIPCSVYEDIIFEDILPLKRLEDIKNVQYGSNAKIVIPFFNSPSKKISILNDRLGCFFDPNCQYLTLYYTGLASHFSLETIAEIYRQDRPMLEKGFDNQCPPFMTPVIAKDQAFSIYKGPVGYSWPNDPYVKGSYSYIAPGQESVLIALKEEQGEIVKTLFAPIDQNLYFAGEHASTLIEVPGTMEAACESGEKAARMILSSLDLK